MSIGIIGKGAIGSYVRQHAIASGINVGALVLRPEALQQSQETELRCVDCVSDIPKEINCVIDCAGHAALRSLGPEILRQGFPLITVSLGALADDALMRELEKAAEEGQSRLHLATGAIGALDCLQAAKIGGLTKVTYIGRKPPKGWKGSPAEERVDLDQLGQKAFTHFKGSARDAAIAYPKNANVAAAVALAGRGLDKTHVRLIADPMVTQNIHQIEAVGTFGSFTFEIKGKALPDNPRSSALAAMSVLSKLGQQTQRVSF